MIAVEVDLDAHSFGIGGHGEMYRLIEGDGVRDLHAVAEHLTGQFCSEQEGSGIGPVENLRPPPEKRSERILVKGHGRAMQETLAFERTFPPGASTVARAKRPLSLPLWRAWPSAVTGNIGGVDDTKVLLMRIIGHSREPQASLALAGGEIFAAVYTSSFEAKRGKSM